MSQVRSISMLNQNSELDYPLPPDLPVKGQGGEIEFVRLLIRYLFDISAFYF